MLGWIKQGKHGCHQAKKGKGKGTIGGNDSGRKKWKNRKHRERYHQKKAGKPDFAFLNSVLPFFSLSNI